MQRKTLGVTGMEISKLGLGSLAIGGAHFGTQDDEVSVRTVHAAIDKGINWVHAPAAYGLGHAQEVVGRAIRELPTSNRPYVFVSIINLWDEGEKPSQTRKDLSPAAVRKHVENSLRRTGVERLDLVDLHIPDTNTPIEDTWEALGDMIQEGKVRATGLSNHPVELCERANAVRHVDAIQPPLSMLDRSSAFDLLPWAEGNQTGVFVYGTMQHGLLTGAFSQARVVALREAAADKSSESKILPNSADQRPDWNWFREPELSRALELVDRLRPIADRHETTLASVAVAWSLAWPAVTAAVVGAHRPDQLEGWIEASELTLTEADLDEIQQAINETKAGGVLQRATNDWVGQVRPERPPRGV